MTDKEKEEIENLIKGYKEKEESEKYLYDAYQDVGKKMFEYSEKCDELEEKLKIATAMLTGGTYPSKNEDDNNFDKQFIPVSKVKEKIQFYKNYGQFPTNKGEVEYVAQDEIDLLESLLEDN